MAAWVPIADVPGGGGDTWMVCSHAGKIYLAGGWTSTYTTGYPNVLEYDPVANTYTDKAPLPQPVVYGCSAYWNGVFYLISGDTAGGALTQMWGYDIATDTWNATLAALPYGAEDGVAFGVAGKLIVVGGWDVSLAHAHVQIYDVATNTWTVGTDWPGSTAGRLGYQAAASDGTDLFVLGGYGNQVPTGPSQDLTGIWKYTIATDTWSHVDDLPYGVEASAWFMVGTKVYLVSGESGSTYLSGTVVFDLVSGAHEHDTDYPLTVWGPQGIECGGDVFVFAGYQYPPGIEYASAYRLTPDPQPGWPSLPETPGDAFARPIMLSSVTGAGTVTATTVGATSESGDPTVAGFAGAPSINFKVPLVPTAPGTVIDITVHGPAGANWAAVLEQRNVPDDGSYSSWSSGSQAGGTTWNISQTAPDVGAYQWYLVVFTATEASFTVDYTILVPQPTPTVDGIYTVLMPEMPRLHGFRTNPAPPAIANWTSIYGPWAGSIQTDSQIIAVVPYAPNDLMIITWDSMSDSTAGAVGTTAVRHVHVTDTAVTIDAGTEVWPTPPMGGPGTNRTNQVSRVSFHGPNGIGVLQAYAPGTTEIRPVGFDATTQTFTVGALMPNITDTRQLSATRGVMIPNIAGKIEIVDLVGTAPTLTETTWQVFGNNVGDVFDGSIVTLARLTNNSCLVYMSRRYVTSTSPFTVGPYQGSVAVMTVTGTSVSFGPATDVAIDYFDPQSFNGDFRGNSFASNTATFVEIPRPGTAPVTTDFTIASDGTVSVTSFTPPDPATSFGIGATWETAFGLAWAWMKIAGREVLAPISRFSQSGVQYSIRSPEQPDLSIDMTRAIAWAFISGDPTNDFSLWFTQGHTFPILVNLVAVMGAGDLLVYGPGVGYTFNSEELYALSIPGADPGPLAAQHSSIASYTANSDPSGSDVIVTRRASIDLPGSIDTASHLFIDDSREPVDHWAPIDAASHVSGQSPGWRRPSALPGGYTWGGFGGLGISIASGTPTVIGTRLPPGVYLANPGDSIEAFTVASGRYQTDPEVCDGRISIEFYNDTFGLITATHGPWLELPRIVGRPLHCTAVAPAGTVMATLTVEMRRQTGAAFDPTMYPHMEVWMPDMIIGPGSGFVDLGDGGLAPISIGHLIASGPSTPGGVTQLAVDADRTKALGPVERHEAVRVAADGSIWAVVELDAAGSYGYRIRHYTSAGTLLHDFPAVGRPLALAPTLGYVYYVNGNDSVLGIHIATGTPVVVFTADLAAIGYDGAVLLDLCVFVAPAGPGPAPAGSGLTGLPSDLQLIVMDNGSAYLLTATGATYISYTRGDGIVAGTLALESPRSIAYLELAHTGYLYAIGRMWTDNINWHLDGEIILADSRVAAPVGLIPALAIRGPASFRGLDTTVSKGRKVIPAGKVHAGNLRPNASVSAARTVTIVYRLDGPLYDNGPDPARIDIDGFFARATVTVDVPAMPATDFQVRFYRDGALVGSIDLPPGVATMTGELAIRWGSGQQFTFLIVPGDGTSQGLTVTTEWESS